ncbi:MAG: hypothetical protein ACR2M1_08360 [Gemmatimonadaceae bacterium]
MSLPREELVRRALAVLADDPTYRVFRAPPRRVVQETIPENTPVVRCLLVDAQAGGIDAEHAPLLEIGALPVTIGRADGHVYRVGRPCVMFDDPGSPVPDAVVRRTGITDRMVRGHKLSPSPFATMIAQADAVVAFNAAFDRPLLERYVPEFADIPWLCAYSEIDWTAHGLLDGSLESLCARHACLYLPVRRSVAHIDAMLDLVTTPWHDGALPIVSLFDAAKKMRALVWAPNPRFEANDALRDRQYRFHQSKSLGRGWYAYVAPSAIRDELTWLAQTIYGGRLPINARAVPVGARIRHASLTRILNDAATDYLMNHSQVQQASPSFPPPAIAA